MKTKPTQWDFDLLVVFNHRGNHDPYCFVLLDDASSLAKLAQIVFASIQPRSLAHRARIVGGRVEHHDTALESLLGSQYRLNVDSLGLALLWRLCAKKVFEQSFSHRLE